MGNESSSRGPLDSELRARLADVVTRHGETGAARLLGISRNALARALGGLTVYRGTRAQIRLALDGKA